MDNRNSKIPNVMPDAMIIPITDTELIVAKLKYTGRINKHSLVNQHFENKHKEV
ncbi:MAG: hypothetical protein WBL93_08285 [Lutisporaceae bacterium]